MTSRLDQRFAALKRDGRSALVAYVTATLIAIAFVQPASAQEESTPDYIGITLSEKIRPVDCPMRPAGPTSVTFVSVSNDADVTSALFQPLIEQRWVLANQFGGNWLFVRWTNADCIERLMLSVDETGTVVEVDGQRTLFIMHQPVCGVLESMVPR